MNSYGMHIADIIEQIKSLVPEKQAQINEKGKEIILAKVYNTYRIETDEAGASWESNCKLKYEPVATEKGLTMKTQKTLELQPNQILRTDLGVRVHTDARDDTAQVHKKTERTNKRRTYSCRNRGILQHYAPKSDQYKNIDPRRDAHPTDIDKKRDQTYTPRQTWKNRRRTNGL